MVNGREVPTDGRWNIAGIGALILAAIVVACAAGIAAMRADEPMPSVSGAPLIDPKPQKIFVIGDSYTEGTAQGGVGEKNWTNLAWRQLRRENIDIMSIVSGRGGSGYVTRGNAGTTFGQEVRRLMEPGDDDEDIVMIFGGSNDETALPESVTASVRETLSDVRARTRKAKLIVVGPVWPGPNPSPEILQIPRHRAGRSRKNERHICRSNRGWMVHCRTSTNRRRWRSPHGCGTRVHVGKTLAGHSVRTGADSEGTGSCAAGRPGSSRQMIKKPRAASRQVVNWQDSCAMEFL